MSGQTSADTTESLVLQRLRALGMVETKNQQREQNNFHDSGAIPNLESRKKVFMDQGGAKNDDYNASNQADSPTVAQRLAALHKKTECDVDSEKLENVGTVKERCKALHTQQTPIGGKLPYLCYFKLTCSDSSREE